MAVTVDDVRKAVILALDEHFPDIDIYGEEIKQGFEEPCFFVKMFPTAQEREFNRRYKRSHSFDIHFFAETNAECHEMNEKLYEFMEYISINGGLLRGKSMSGEIIDGVLHFNVDFEFHVMREKKVGPVMKSLTQEGGLKGE